MKFIFKVTVFIFLVGGLSTAQGAGKTSPGKIVHPFRTPVTAYSFTAQWGSPGSDSGQFNWPIGIAVDRTTNLVYVVDNKNNRVEKFDANGAYLGQWGGFNSPSGVTVDGQGHVFVTDSLNQRVQMFDTNGGHLTQWGNAGAGNGQFHYPYGVAADGAGNVYVVDNVNTRVEKFHWAHFLWLYFVQYQTQWPATWPQKIAGPAGIALNGSDLYVSMGNHIQKFNTSGVGQHEWGISGTTPPHFSNAMGMAVNAVGNLLVADQGENLIQQWTPAGIYLNSFGGPGTTAGKFHSCIALALDATGNLYVCDRDNNRIQKFSPH